MTRPLEWMAAVRDHPERPTGTQRTVLNYLALRMDWKTGCGFASTGMLAADADCRERTVRNATTWARKAEMLVQTRRGHRLGDGRTISSEWRLVMPVSTGTPMPVEGISTGTDRHLNRHGQASQPARGAPPSRTSSSRTSSSARGASADAPRPPRAEPENPARHIWPCVECGEEFSPDELADETNRQAAEEGELWHAECQKAYMAGDEYRAFFDTEQEWRDEYRATWGAEP